VSLETHFFDFIGASSRASEGGGARLNLGDLFEITGLFGLVV
jgi:hypothetical protein